jgi:glutaredoxin 3
MKRVEIFTIPTCGFCVAAKALLHRKGVRYEEVDVARDPSLRQTMTDRANGRRTVPQIFIGGVHLGSFDELRTLELEGRLDRLLAA